MSRLKKLLISGLGCLALLFVSVAYPYDIDLNRKASDATITARVKAQFASDDVVSAMAIHVKTKERIVYLSGEVDTAQEYQRAISLAESVQNVVDVNANDLKVRSSNAPLSDSMITGKVLGLILRDRTIGTETSNSSVTVETKNGVVYLSGNVVSDNQRRHIIHLAQSVKGVRKVQDNLQVASS